MVDNFHLVKHNFVSHFDPEKCSSERIRPWIRFLNEHSLIRDAISRDAPLKTEPLWLMCSTFALSPDTRSFSFKVGETSYVVNESILNTVLNLPNSDFVDPPLEVVMTRFFNDIHYRSAIDLSKMSKKFLVAEWDYFFDIISKAFSNSTKTGFHSISSLIQRIGFAIVYNQRINIGRLLWTVIVNRLVVAKSDFDQGSAVYCYYPRFLTLIFNHVVSDDHQRMFVNSASEVSGTTHKKFFTRLDTMRKYTHIPVVITPYMSIFINQPIIPEPAPV